MSDLSDFKRLIHERAVDHYQRDVRRLKAEGQEWKRLALDMGEQLMIENEKHPNYNITKLLARLDGIANKDKTT